MRRLWLACALLSGWALPAAGQTPAERGAALAEARSCGACHGERGVSATPEIPSLAGQQAGFITLQLVLFREGLRDVPAMAAPVEGLSDGELEDLAAYFAALPHAAAPDRARRRVAAYNNGAALVARLRCGTCHLPSLAGQNQVPHIAGQREDFLAATLRAYREDRRQGSDTQMNGVMRGVRDSEIDAIAHYLSQR
ncbi:c-type cytochrome [Pseudoroseomonas globiformis]|uniref:C-type cytochrome n=1 Tax=Teichococcus globiformis TaxID=2307229 RepID=A0ABV7G3R2_9PROT